MVENKTKATKKISPIVLLNRVNIYILLGTEYYADYRTSTELKVRSKPSKRTVSYLPITKQR